MPLDGTELGFFEDHPLAKLGAVERLLATEQQWCKGKLRDSDGRHCLVGALQAVKARHTLEPIVLRAAREVGRKHYWRLELFNDDPRTTHGDVLRVLRQARENVIVGLIEAGQRPPWRRRFVQELRAWCSRGFADAYTALRCGGLGRPLLEPAVTFTGSPDKPSTTREVCDALRNLT